MNLRELIQADNGWLDAPTPRRVLHVALAACAGLALYGFTVGYWRDPVMGGYVALKLPLLVALTLICNGLLNGLLGLLLGSGLGFRQSLLALLTSFAIAGVILGAQFSWILRPFFGTPNLEVQFLRPDPMNGNFYQTVWRSIDHITGGHGAPTLSVIILLLTQEKKFFLQHWGATFGESLTPRTQTPEPPSATETTPSNGGRNPFNDN